MAQRLRKTLIAAATVVGLSTISPAAEPLMRQQTEKPKVTAQDTKSDDDTNSMLIILTSMIVAGSATAYLLTRKGNSFFDDNDSNERQ